MILWLWSTTFTPARVDVLLCLLDPGAHPC